MTEEAKKAVKAKVGKAPNNPAGAQRSAGSQDAQKNPVQPLRASQDTKGKLKLTQLTGTIARQSDQRATLIGLRLNKRHRVSVLQDTPEIRGMIYKVRHLVRVEQA